MPSQSRKHRGYATQRMVAEWFRGNGWPYAESTGAGRPGSDITGMIGVDLEVKATSRFEPTAWLAQLEARGRTGNLAAGIWRPNGYGPAGIAHWPVILTLEQFTGLLKAWEVMD